MMQTCLQGCSLVQSDFECVREIFIREEKLLDWLWLLNGLGKQSAQKAC